MTLRLASSCPGSTCFRCPTSAFSSSLAFAKDTPEANPDGVRKYEPTCDDKENITRRHGGI